MDNNVADSYPASYTYDAGGTANFEAVPSPGYRFVGWRGDVTGSSDSASIQMTCDKEVTAIFALSSYYILTVDISPRVGGEVIVEPPQPAEGYIMGTEVTLSAVASEGYQFSYWSGTVSGSGKQLRIIMDSDKELIANFIEVSSSSLAWGWIINGVVVMGLLLYLLASGKLGSQ